MARSATFNLQCSVIGRLSVLLMHGLVLLLLFWLNLPVWVLPLLSLLLVCSAFHCFKQICETSGACLVCSSGLWHYSKADFHKQLSLKAYYLMPWLIRLQFEETNAEVKKTYVILLFADAMFSEQWREIRALCINTGV